MQKLIELLNEYRNDGVEEYLENIESFKIKGGHYSDLYIISKKFGFIKRLVENEKIELCPISKDYRIQIDLFGDGATYGELGGEYRILMLLAIQDEPINFLISILK